jgi:hypothetical protein
MFAEGWITMVAGKRAGFRRATTRTKRRANRHRHKPIVEHYLDMVARSIMRPRSPAKAKS